MKKILYLTISAFIFGVGISSFIDPNNLAPGGFSGIAIVLSRITDLNTGILLFILNIPVIIVGMIKFGRKFMLRTIYSIFATSFFIRIMALFPPATNDILLGATVGSALVGIGVGIAIRCGATTGGMDIVVKLLRLKLPYLKTGKLYLLADAVVIGLSVFVFGNLDSALYAGIGVMVNAAVLDMVLYGDDEAKFFYIISDSGQQIAERIIKELVIGVTFIEGRGGYSGKEKKILLCVIKKQAAPKIEEIVKEEDPMAFLIVTNATEIFGEGYKSITAERL